MYTLTMLVVINVYFLLNKTYKLIKYTYELYNLREVCLACYVF